MDGYLAFAKQLARDAGQLIADGLDSDLEVEHKADASPVTQIDKSINELVIQRIRASFADHGVLGEEADYGTGKEQFQWLCDPLDGTKAFVLGVPLSTFVIGLFKDGEVQLSVVYNPYLKRLYHATRGQGAFCNDKPIQVNQERLTEGGCVVVSESSFQFADGLKAAGAKLEPLPGAGYRCTVLASGKASGIIQTGADYHDVGAASLLVEEAGGKITDLKGESIVYTEPITSGIVISNGSCHDELLKVAARK